MELAHETTIIQYNYFCRHCYLDKNYTNGTISNDDGNDNKNETVVMLILISIIVMIIDT